MVSRPDRTGPSGWRDRQQRPDRTVRLVGAVTRAGSALQVTAAALGRPGHRRGAEAQAEGAGCFRLRSEGLGSGSGTGQPAAVTQQTAVHRCTESRCKNEKSTMALSHSPRQAIFTAVRCCLLEVRWTAGRHTCVGRTTQRRGQLRGQLAPEVTAVQRQVTGSRQSCSERGPNTAPGPRAADALRVRGLRARAAPFTANHRLPVHSDTLYIRSARLHLEW